MKETAFHFGKPGFILLLMGLLGIASCKKDKPQLSNLAGITAFSIKDLQVSFTIDESQLKIYNADSLPFGTNVSSLTANFTAVPYSVVTVSGTEQVSGTTVNNFSQPLQYVVTAQDKVTTRTYTVQVNVAKVDPKTVSWQQLTADAGWGNFHSTGATALNGMLYFMGGTMGSFGAFSFTSDTSSNGANWVRTRAVDNNGDSVPRMEHPAFLSFDNKLWLLGGHHPGVGFAFDYVTNDIWSSSDGVSWEVSEPADPSQRWSARERIGAVVFNNKLWVIGGNSYPSFGNTNVPSAAYNDVWNSSDGINWTQVTASADFIPRTNPAIFVYKNKMWVVGGKDNGGNYLNDVWTSEDGASWTQVSTTSSFTGRWGHQVVVNNDQLLLVGGENADGVSGDLWVSENDGVDWTKAGAGDVRALPASFKGRKEFSMFVEGGSVYIIGGLGVKDNNQAYTYTNDVWKGTFHD